MQKEIYVECIIFFCFFSQRVNGGIAKNYTRQNRASLLLHFNSSGIIRLITSILFLPFPFLLCFRISLLPCIPPQKWRKLFYSSRHEMHFKLWKLSCSTPTFIIISLFHVYYYSTLIVSILIWMFDRMLILLFHHFLYI